MAAEAKQMSNCPRLLTKEQLIAGLKSGRMVFIEREDAPELDDLKELTDQELVNYQVIQIEGQYVAKFWWKTTH
jgi:hypothetical protein